MDKNPYTTLINHMRNQGAHYNPPSIEIGKVSSEDPLVVQVGDLPLAKKNLYMADYLLNGYRRKISIPLVSAIGNTSNGSISSIGIANGELDCLEGLKKDDLVALIQINATKYLILCKVVEA